jgi:MFS family permease
MKLNWKFITRNILFLSLISFFTDVASELLYPVIPLYLSSIGISVSGIGIIEGMAEAIAAISKTYFGIWSDRIQKRKLFIIVGYGLSALSKPLMVLVPNYFWVLLMRVSDRLGKGIRTAPRDALLSDESLSKDKGKVFGFHRSMDTLGAAVGPFIALTILMVYNWSYQSLFLLAFIPGVLAMIFSFLIKEKKSINTIQEKKKIQFKELFSYWNRSSREFRVVSVLIIVFYLFNSSDMLLLLKARTNQISDSQVIILYIIYNISYAVLAFPFGVIGDKLGLKNTIAFGLMFFGIVYLGISLFNNWYEMIVLFILYGMYSAAIEGNIKAFLSNLTDRKETATAIGLFTTLQSATFLISNSLAGWLWDTFNSSLPFILSGAVAMIISVLLFIYKIPKSSSKE